MPVLDKSHMNIFELYLEDTMPDKGMEYFVNERSVRVHLRVSPELVEIGNKHLSSRGRSTWSTPMGRADGQDDFIRFANEVLAHNDGKHFPFGRALNFPPEEATFLRTRYAHAEHFPQHLIGHINRKLSDDAPRFIFPNSQAPSPVYPVHHAPHGLGRVLDQARGGSIMLEIDRNNVMWLRPNISLDVDRAVREVFGEDTPLLKRKDSSVLISPQKAQQLVDKFAHTRLVVASNEVLQRIKDSATSIGIGSFPGEPASVAASIGTNVQNKGRLRLKAGSIQKVSMDRAEKIQAEYGDKVLFHPELHDIIAMRKAKPFKQKDLRDYQQEAVGLHLATNIGYVQTCSPGMGKTVIQLSAMRERARNIPNYRGLVVCEANVRGQWKEEAEKWFPEAEIVVISSSKHVGALNRGLALSDKPLVVIMSYSLTTGVKAYQTQREEESLALQEAMRFSQMDKVRSILFQQQELSIAMLLLSVRWNDLCADEAVVIRTGNSKQYQSMWTLREHADVAVPMSATPINTSIDDLMRLISWARGNRNMFSGITPAFDTQTASGAKKMFDSMRPLIFRRDTSEIKGEIPKTNDTMRLLTPSASEKALITAAESELKRCYLELMAAMDELEKLGEVDADDLAKARLNLREANGAWLGGKQLARIATSDATALHESNSMGAALLQSQGLVDAASQQIPTKMKFFIEEAQARVLKGEKILVFTSFTAVAERLTKALQDVGIKAKSFTGKNSQTRDVARVEFQNGELDVLVSTKAGTRGLTLHRANAIYHYDIPYTLEEVIQRTGRGVRIGSKNKDINVVFMIMENTIEHKVAEHIVEQGIIASLVLDGARNRDLSQTETASTISGLLGAATSFTTGNNKAVLDFGKILGISKQGILGTKDAKTKKSRKKKAAVAK